MLAVVDRYAGRSLVRIGNALRVRRVDYHRMEYRTPNCARPCFDHARNDRLPITLRNTDLDIVTARVSQSCNLVLREDYVQSCDHGTFGVWNQLALPET